ncbi:SusC/RagA family TonB-linked outer membrane protein [Spirosoma sordidisoli]|uniref:SusC/RagA family TonB-linked outer membrane protein n=1 Tax=Spirosoma sordidisoli TaxID=2502893 RepID=A0A4Q2UX78_9BACT|nr:SusC/RagA family TonB-linked outer membrane protein [Spirosoma sordidisoli]RYC71639.1 SusC/RagA family TonB-linked outer membrane protein [Spirosoma sordidisoli]
MRITCIRLLLGGWLLLILPGLAFAQERIVSGKITNVEDGTPIPGASVSIKGTNRGTTTDVNGTYRLNVGTDNGLVVSFVGMMSQEVEIGSRSVIDVALKPDSRQLTEVVVTALGIQKEAKGLGFSQTSINNQELTVGRTTNIANALSGKIAGVRIAGSNGMTGSSSNIQIRGLTTFTQSNQPLFVVDGIPVDNGGGVAGSGLLNTSNSQTGVSNSNRGIDLNQDDIETMTVLKGPAAAALYGSRAAAGVIMITTKKGRANGNKKNTVNYTGSFNVVEVNRFPDYQNEYARGTSLNAQGQPAAPVYQPNADQLSWGPVIRGQRVASSYSAADRTLFNLPDSVTLTAYPNNVRNMFRQGINQQHNVSFSGATDKSNYYFSYGMLSDRGFLENNQLDRHTFSANANSQLTSRLSVGTNIQYIYNTSKRSQIGNQLANPLFRGWFLPRDYDLLGEPNTRPDGSQVYFNANTDHPFWTLRNNLYDDNRSRLIGNVNLTYKLTDWLSYTGRAGTDMFTENRFTVDAIGSRGQANHAVAGVGAIGNRNITRRETSFYNTFTATRDLTEDLRMTALVGSEINQINQVDQAVVGNTLATRDFNNINNATNFIPYYEQLRRRLVGVFANVDLRYKGWANLTLTGRNDWSSTFAAGNRSYFYPSASGSVILSDALPRLFADQRVLSFAKVKGAWARVGREAFLFATATYFDNANPSDGFGPQIQYPFLGQQGRTLQDGAGNPQLGPEFTRSLEYGVELKFWENRIGLDITHFNQRSTDIIISVPIAAASGFTNVARNAGVLESRGWEWNLSITPIRKANFKWDIGFNGARIRNNVISLAEGVQNISLGPFTTAQGRIQAGLPYGTMFANTLLRTPQGQLVVNPTNGLPILDPRGLQNVGDPNPRWTGGVINNFSYKGINLNFLIDIRRGGDVLSRVVGDLRRTGVAAETADRPRFGADGQPLRNYTIDGVYGNGTINPTTNAPVLTTREGQALASGQAPVANDIAISGQQYWGQLYTFNAPGMFVFDGSWTRLREASVTYTVPKKWLDRTPFGSLEVGVNGRNLLLWTKVPHIDPEFNVNSNQNLQGIEFNTMPQARTYGALLRLSF